MSDALSHRLAAVWFADIAGYTGLASRNESEALRLVRLFQQGARDTAGRFGGRIVKFTGDGALAEFTSTESAVRAADALAREFRLLAEAARLPSPALHFGVHVGEVASAPDGDLYGDGLNVAARLESLSAPGQILASEDVWRQLRQRPEFRFESLGERTLEGRETPVQVYGIVVEGAEEWKGAGAGGLPAPIPSGVLFDSPVLHHPHDRFLRAELLREEGRPGEALGWYRGLTEGVHTFDLPYAAMSHRRMAEIHEAEGDGEQAAFHYASFAELWRESEAELQPLVLDAAARARTLAGEEAAD